MAVAERYIGLLAAALESEGRIILPDEAERLTLFRERHSISHAEHLKALETLACSDAEFISRLKQGEEVATYLHVVAAAVKEKRPDDHGDVNARLAAYREKHAISPALHAAAMQTLATDPARVLTPRDHAIGGGAAKAGAAADGSGGDPSSSGSGSSLVLVPADEDPATAAARLDHLLLQRESQNASRRVELDQVEAAMQEMERRVAACAEQSPLRAAEVTELQKHLDAHEHASAGLQTEVQARRERLKVVGTLLDQREAELYETEEAVREFEAKERQRTDELAASTADLRYVEGRIHARQREVLRLEELASAVERFRVVEEEEESAASGAASGAAAASSSAETDADVEARTLRAAAKLRGAGGAFVGDAGYVHFHTLCMGIKLALAGNARLQNVRIDDLWEEVRRAGMARSEWREFAQSRLLPQDDAAASYYGAFAPFGSATVGALSVPGTFGVGAMALAGETLTTLADGVSSAFSGAFWQRPAAAAVPNPGAARKRASPPPRRPQAVD